MSNDRMSDEELNRRLSEAVSPLVPSWAGAELRRARESEARLEKEREATEEEVGRLITETHDLNAGLQLHLQERDAGGDRGSVDAAVPSRPRRRREKGKPVSHPMEVLNYMADLNRATARIATLERQLAEAQAQMGAMREALEQSAKVIREIDEREGTDHFALLPRIDAALAPEAGKELLARLDRAETQLSALREEACEFCEQPVWMTTAAYDHDHPAPRVAGIWVCGHCYDRNTR